MVGPKKNKQVSSDKFSRIEKVGKVGGERVGKVGGEKGAKLAEKRWAKLAAKRWAKVSGKIGEWHFTMSFVAFLNHWVTYLSSTNYKKI